MEAEGKKWVRSAFPCVGKVGTQSHSTYRSRCLGDGPEEERGIVCFGGRIKLAVIVTQMCWSAVQLLHL